jgi:hypothetical protein
VLNETGEYCGEFTELCINLKKKLVGLRGYSVNFFFYLTNVREVIIICAKIYCTKLICFTLFFVFTEFTQVD